ncbi:MAG TPA: LpqB family beta-propeller domain-containing protein [Candidatus Binataceae bacterium]|nr:LpqB family beta-propeller domain-containing protein [Candidatus Binataceae bacterium]
MAVGIVCLAASAASAQMPNYWLATPPSVVGAPPAPPPPPEIPDVPFAAARDVQSVATLKIDKDFKPIAPQAPLWMGSNEVALLGTRHGQITLLAYYGEHFANSRVLADPSTVRGGTILDMAVSRDGRRLAIAAATHDKLQIWLRDTNGDAPASVAAAMDGAYSKAGIAWLDAATLAVGTQSAAIAAPTPTPAPDATQPPTDNPQPPAEPTRSLHVVKIGAQEEPASLDLDCLEQVDPTAILWSPDGNYGIGQVDEQDKWMLIDRSKVSCEALKLPAIAPAGFIAWEKESRQFLFTATPARLRDTSHVGVMEYSLKLHKARLLASPATAAAYVNAGRIAILGSRHLNAAMIVRSPDTLMGAEIAWINPGQGELNIVPTGFKTTAAELLGARLRYSVKGLLATSFQTPGPKGAFTVLLWLSAASDNGGVLGTGRIGRMTAANWSPDGSKLAVLAGLPETPTLAIIASPQ